MKVKDLITHLQSYSPEAEVGMDGELGYYRVSGSYIFQTDEIVPFSRKRDGSYEVRDLSLIVLQKDWIHQPT